MKKSVVVLNIIAASLLLLYYLLIVFGLVSGAYFGPTVSFVCVMVFLEVFLSVYRYMHEDDVTELKIQKLYDDTIVPTRGSDGAAGLDLYAHINEYIKIPAHKAVKIGTGVAVEIPHGMFGGIYARSGLANKKGAAPANCVGVIDEDYRGEIVVSLRNYSNYGMVVQPGDRIAQLVIEPYVNVAPIEVSELSNTDRGAGGFGSTGM